MDLLRMIQQSKTDHGQSKLLDVSSLTTETDQNLTISKWVNWINLSQQYHQGVAVDTAQEYFGTQETIAFSSGTNEYALKGDELRIRLIERTDTDPDRIISPIIINDRLKVIPGYGNWDIFRSNEYSYLWGNMIGFVAGEAGTANVLYIRRLPDLSYGTASAASETSITLASSPTFGTTFNENDYYNGATIQIISGTNSGQREKITDYVGSTRVATVSSWPGGTPSGTIVYNIVCDIPEQHHEAICVYAAIKAKISDHENVTQLKLHHLDLVGKLESDLSPRSSQSPRYVNYEQDFGYDF